MRSWLRNTWRGLRNLVTFAPMVWRDRDWDHGYLFVLLEFKLRRMYAALSGPDAVAAHPEKALRKLLMCAEICKRLTAGEFAREEWDEYHRAHPIDWSLGVWGPPSEACRRHLRRVANKEKSIEAHHLALLCNTIRRCSRNWWD